MSEEGPRVRNICFTINGEDLLLLDPMHPTWSHVKFLIYQRELGTHEHFQGYLELDQQVTFAKLHTFEGLEGAHFERRRGTAKQARHYCEKPVAGCDCEACRAETAHPTKIDGPWLFGEMSAQGQRAELLEIKRELDRGMPLKRVQDGYFPEWVRFHKSFTEYRRGSTLPRDFKTKVALFIGPPGVGKSTLMKVIARVNGWSAYKVPAKKGSGLYFDDYDNQDVLILDEFSGATCPPEFFNLIADEHECVLPVHGGAGHQMVSKYLFIGSNYAPKFWWKHRSPIQLKQTLRRIDIVFKCGFKHDPLRFDADGNFLELHEGQYGFPENVHAL